MPLLSIWRPHVFRQSIARRRQHSLLAWRTAHDRSAKDRQVLHQTQQEKRNGVSCDWDIHDPMQVDVSGVFDRVAGDSRTFWRFFRSCAPASTVDSGHWSDPVTSSDRASFGPHCGCFGAASVIYGISNTIRSAIAMQLRCHH